MLIPLSFRFPKKKSLHPSKNLQHFPYRGDVISINVATVRRSKTNNIPGFAQNVKLKIKYNSNTDENLHRVTLVVLRLYTINLNYQKYELRFVK